MSIHPTARKILLLPEKLPIFETGEGGGKFVFYTYYSRDQLMMLQLTRLMDIVLQIFTG